jgi:hypothetical protein
MVKVQTTGNNFVNLEQPLRIDFPVKDGSRAYKMHLISGCGVENLYIKQVHKMPKIQTVMFTKAVNCWAKDVKVEMSGRNPVYAMRAKWITIKDCEFNGSWNCGGGGTGYVGFEQGWECLMENVKTKNMRHAPCLEWSSSGCVIRNSTFVNSDAQCHSGWCRENLFENCTIINPSGDGSYGYGFFTTPPRDSHHGPIGPRNVIYNCDFQKVRKSALVLNGMNEGWIIAHNRFESRAAGILIKDINTDHIIANNVFIVHRFWNPAIKINTAEPENIIIKNNKLYGGNGNIIKGNTNGASIYDNNTFSIPDQLPVVPKPKVDSIYEWQQKYKNEKNLP